MAKLISVVKLDSPPHGACAAPDDHENGTATVAFRANMWKANGGSPVSQNGLCDIVVQNNPSYVDRRYPVTVSWKTISMTTREGKQILKDVSGDVCTGELTAIMGPSGAGKSTLLNILSGFKSQNVTGEIMVNGSRREMSAFRKLSCYIMQDDHLLPHLTVKESISVAAALKISRSVSAEQRQTAVGHAIRSLGLSEVQNNKASQLSGGQRKRLCIAQELVSNPPLIFLDEPTSGLDSSSCLQCIELLKSLATEGRTVVCTIHQPSARIFERFDKLYMLADGVCIYRGYTRGLLPFLTDEGLRCPQYHNPTDFAMEVAMGEHGNWVQHLKDAVDRDFYEESSSGEHTAGSSVQCLSDLGSTLEASTLCLLQDRINRPSTFKESYRGFATSSWNQFTVLTARSIRCTLREPMATQLRLFAHVVVGLLLGMLYYGIGNDASKIFNNSGFLFFSLLFLIFTAMMPTVLTFPMERTIFSREHLNSWYSTRMYYLAKTIAEIPFQIVFPIIYCSIVYWMTFQPNNLVRFGLFVLSSIMISLVAQSIGLLIGASTSVQNAVFLAPVVSIPILLFSGFFISLDTIPPYLKWLSYISYIRYSYQSVLLAIYSLDRPELHCDKMFCPFQEPLDFLKEMDMLGANLYLDYGAQILFFLVFRTVAYLVLRFRIKNNR